MEFFLTRFSSVAIVHQVVLEVVRLATLAIKTGAVGERLQLEAMLVRLAKTFGEDYDEQVRKDAKDARSLASVAMLSGPVAETPPWRKLLIGQSQKTLRVAEVIQLVAPRRCTVLISGETGTGKEVVARSIHAAGPRAHLPMVSVNCSALPEHLLEAELFGHTKGAFTGAVGNRIGHFEQAHHSTLVLDEIADMPLALQSKLLRALQEREFRRLGSSETVRVDVRVIAATNTDLALRVKNGTFREDLYYRLNVVPLVLSPLRERPADIGLLVNHFLEKICRNEKLPLCDVTPEALDNLIRYEWPGNVRQLENAIEMAIALSGYRRRLVPSDFQLPDETPVLTQSSRTMVTVPDHGFDFEQTVRNIERHILEQALRKTGGNKTLAAEMLHLKRTTLVAKVKSLTAAAAGS
ncbi:MAG: sigma-54 interaction domain-containing protein [Bryobacteraceae bacterium]